MVEGLPPLTVEEVSCNQLEKGHSTNFTSRLDYPGFIKVTKKHHQEIKLPSLPLKATSKSYWSREDLKEFWENTLVDPPRDIYYIIGDPLFPVIELSPGEGLNRVASTLPGINTTYIYMSYGISISVMHGEDAEFRSINLLRAGECKCWIIVQPEVALVTPAM